MTTTRDAFEIEANLYDLDLNRFKEGYSDCNTDYGWLFWQAATLAEKRQPLTTAEIADLWDLQTFHITDQAMATDFVRDVEAAHGIKA